MTLIDVSSTTSLKNHDAELLKTVKVQRSSAVHYNLLENTTAKTPRKEYGPMLIMKILREVNTRTETKTHGPDRSRVVCPGPGSTEGSSARKAMKRKSQHRESRVIEVASRRYHPKMEELDKSLGGFELSVWFASLYCGTGPCMHKCSYPGIVHTVDNPSEPY